MAKKCFQDLQKQNDQLYLELNKIEGENQQLHNQFTTSEQQFSTSPHLTKVWKIFQVALGAVICNQSSIALYTTKELLYYQSIFFVFLTE